MIAKYFATLAVAVLIVTFPFSLLEFVTRSHVLGGQAVDEVVELEFTIAAGDGQYYKISPRIAQFLQEHISFPTDGAARVVSSKITITPKKVAWSENKKHYTAPGAAMSAQIRWETPGDSADGTRSNIYINFPEIPGLEGKTPTYQSGGYQKDDEGRYVIREVTTYRDALRLFLGRFAFALSIGLPVGILLHTIFFAFVVVREKRLRLAALPPRGPGWPQTFYPDPIAEWTIWLIGLAICSAMPSLMVGFSIADRFVSFSSIEFAGGFLAVGIVIVLAILYIARRYLLTVRVDATSISYARGRGDLQWTTAIWGEIDRLVERSRTSKGSTTYWLELEFKDKRKRLKITPSIEGYQELKAILKSVFPG